MALGLAETARLAVRIDLEGNLNKGISGLTKQVKGLDSSLGRVGRGAGQIGAGLSRAGLLVGGAAVTGLGAAAKAAIDFEDAFAGVKKTMNEADLIAAGTSFEELRQNFRDMAKEIPIAATEFARLGEIAGALGVHAADVDEFVKTTALLGVTTNLSADEAADAFGRIGTILNLTGDDYEELADSIVALGNAGASTESEITEITKRFAAEAKAAGLMKEEIVGLASAAASLGFAPERGGTALARVFANMGTNISLANKKGKAFAKLVGEPIGELQDKIDRGEGLPIFLDVLQAIKGLSPTDANRTLKALGITNTSDRTIFRSMAANLPEVTRQLKVATTATGALGKEAQKRFDTVASKIQVLKNNLIDAGISIGEGMIPAIGRATEKLTKFLQQPGNVNELKNLGKEIGEAIDGIDWDEVIRTGKDMVGVFKSAFGWAKKIFDVFNSLPAEIKGATVGLLALNKLSDGLIGSGVGGIVGGLGEALAKSLAASIPLFGRAFVQPVFVTNMAPGFGGGLPGDGKGGGLGAGKLVLGLTGVGLAAILAEEFSDEIFGLGKDLGRGWRDFLKNNTGIDIPTISPSDLEWPFGPKNTPTILPEIFGGNGLLGGTGAAPPPARGGDRPSPGNPGLVRGQLKEAITPAVAGVTAAVKNAQSIATRENSAQKTEIANVKNAVATQGQQQQALQRTQLVAQAANTLMMSIQGAGQAVRDAVQTSAVRTGATQTATASRTAGTTNVAAQFATAAMIVGAIWAARPIVQSTTVINSYQSGERGGSSADSRSRGARRP